MNLNTRSLSDAARVQAPFTEGPSEIANDLRQFLRILEERKRVILTTVIAVTALVVLVALQLPPRYTAAAKVLIGGEQASVFDLQNAIAGVAPDAAQIESQVHVIRSQALLERLVEQQKLMEDPEFNPALKENAGLISLVSGLLRGVPQMMDRVFSNDKTKAYVTREEDQARLRSEIAQDLGEHLDIKRVDTSFVIGIGVTSASPTKAAKLANALSDLYVVDQLETKFEETRRDTEWLNNRLNVIREDLRKSEEAVAAYKAEHNLLGSAEGVTLDSAQLAELHKNLVLARTAREEAEVRLQQIREIYASGGGLTRVANVVTSDLLTKLREQDAVLMQQQANLASRYQPRHPKMIEVQSARKDVFAKMAEEVRRIVQELESNVTLAKTRENAIEKSLSQQTTRSAGQDQLTVQLRELELEAESNRHIYEAFLAKFKTESEKQTIQQSEARVISRATVPRYPSFPNKKIVAAGGLIFSLLLGIAVALFLDRLDSGIRTATQLQGFTGLRNIAVLPKLKEATPAPHDYVLKKPLSAFSEAIRTIHNALFLSSPKDPIRSVVVASSLPDEGKSTVSISLARLAARAGKKTILVDADLRRPCMYALLENIPHDKTVIDVIEGRVPLEDAIVHDSASNLHVLVAREGGDQSPDLINSVGMSDLVKTLTQLYDLVVIDSPPVLPVADTLVMSRLVDATLYIVRWQETPRDAVASGLALLADANANVLGTVLTQVDIERYARYSYGDAGRHYRRYQGYYVQ